MKKIKFLVIALLLLVSVASAQWTSKTYTYNQGISYGFTLTVDSLTTSYTSPFIDWTLIDGQTVYFNYALVQTAWGCSAGQDTLLVILQGKYPSGGIVNLDTLGAGSAGSEIVISYLTQNAGSLQYTIVPAKVVPSVRFYVAHKNSGGNKNMDASTLWVDIYAKTVDAIYNPTKMGWK